MQVRGIRSSATGHSGRRATAKVAFLWRGHPARARKTNEGRRRKGIHHRVHRGHRATEGNLFSVRSVGSVLRDCQIFLPSGDFGRSIKPQSAQGKMGISRCLPPWPLWPLWLVSCLRPSAFLPVSFRLCRSVLGLLLSAFCLVPALPVSGKGCLSLAVLAFWH